MFRSIRLFGLLAGGAVAFAGNAQAAQRFVLSDDFYAAVGDAVVIESYEEASAGTLIADGTQFNGITYDFSSGAGGIVSNVFTAQSGRNALAGNQGSGGLSSLDFFFAGDSFTLSFSQPVSAVGGFFNIADSTTSSDYIGLQVDGVQVSGGGAVSEANGLFFVGYVADTPFYQVTFYTTSSAPSGFVFDDLSYVTAAAVPEPSALTLLGLGLGALYLVRRRHG